MKGRDSAGGLKAAKRSPVGPGAIALGRAVVDLLTVFAAFAVCFWLYLWAIDLGLLVRAPIHTDYLTITLVFSAILLLVFRHGGLYEERASVLNLWELKTVVRAVLVSGALLLAALFAFKLQSFSRIVIFGSLCLTMAAMVMAIAPTRN